MSIPQNKEELKKAINENYEKLAIEISTVPIHLVHLKDLEGHSKNSTISVHNLVSYLIGWGQLVIKWNDLGKLAQKFYSDYDTIEYRSSI